MRFRLCTLFTVGFKFYGILDGVEKDKETESITMDQIAGKDDITTIFNL
jgi:hypothetical protein